MWLKRKVKKCKKSPVFKLASKFIDIGEDIIRFMREDGRTPEEIIRACVDLEKIENNVLGEE